MYCVVAIDRTKIGDKGQEKVKRQSLSLLSKKQKQTLSTVKSDST